LPDKRCPHCHLWNSETALVCDCGFDFSTGTISRTKTSDSLPVSAAWRIGLSSFSVVLIPCFVLAAYLMTKLGQFPPLLIVLLLAMLVLPPFYWLLYFTRLQRPWARYLMLFMGLASVLAIGLIITAFVMRFINPQ
jgi:hypothetical protein